MAGREARTGLLSLSPLHPWDGNSPWGAQSPACLHAWQFSVHIPCVISSEPHPRPEAESWAGPGQGWGTAARFKSPRLCHRAAHWLGAGTSGKWDRRSCPYRGWWEAGVSNAGGTGRPEAAGLSSPRVTVSPAPCNLPNPPGGSWSTSHTQSLVAVPFTRILCCYLAGSLPGLFFTLNSK